MPMWRAFLAIACLVSFNLFAEGDEAMASTHLSPQTSFSYFEPATFTFGSNEEKNKLRAIAKEEFSLLHLKQEHQSLLEEALRRSGVEVHASCLIDMSIEGELAAFFRRYDHYEKKRFAPEKKVMALASSNPEQPPSRDWQELNGDYTEYPYPMGEAVVLPKVIPINLSSIRFLDDSATHMNFHGRPSKLLGLKLTPKDQLFVANDLRMEISIDRKTRRLDRLTLHLEKPKRVYLGIKITVLQTEYRFGNDESTQRNVLKRVHHEMRGRMGGLLRPRFNFTTELTYDACHAEPQESSYLFASLDSIRALEAPKL
ncbi:MAG: hypothetical protein F4W90_04690 [Gammaproteobacteria bacterium]|nr:hypothetical protein [Gammaproteobacteria bacterium]